jgi:hypothetical protein
VPVIFVPLDELFGVLLHAGRTGRGLDKVAAASAGETDRPLLIL